MSRFSSSYTLGKPTRRCAISGRELSVGETYIASLHDEPSPAPPRRVDYSLDAWRTAGGATALGLLAFWKATVPDPAKPRERIVLDDDALADLFERLDAVTSEEIAAAGSGDHTIRRRAAMRFVVALLMVRRKLFSLQTTRAGTMLLRRKGEPMPPEGPALTEVIDPGVDESTVISVIAELEGEPAGAPAGTGSVA